MFIQVLIFKFISYCQEITSDATAICGPESKSGIIKGGTLSINPSVTLSNQGHLWAHVYRNV